MTRLSIMALPEVSVVSGVSVGSVVSVIAKG